MTLPSTRRPKEVEKILEDEEDESRFIDIKVKIDVKQCFMDKMIGWYNRLSPKQKTALTKRRVIRYATIVAYDLLIPYSNLPENWLRKLYEDHGIHFKFSSRSKQRKVKRKNDRLKSLPQQQGPDTGKNSIKLTPGQIVDLTKEPPPPKWVASYMAGVHMPRVLKVQRDTERDGAIVVYYDYYSNVLCEDGTSIENEIQFPHDRDGVGISFCK